MPHLRHHRSHRSSHRRHRASAPGGTPPATRPAGWLFLTALFALAFVVVLCDDLALRRQRARLQDETAASEPEPAIADRPSATTPPAHPSAAPRAAPAAAAPAATRAGLQAAAWLVFAPNGARVPVPPGVADRLAELRIPEGRQAPFGTELAAGFAALDEASTNDAAARFATVVAGHPDWSYGHYYLAVATGSRFEMARTRDLLTAAATVGELPPEARLIDVLAQLFLGETQGARDALTRLIASDPAGPLELGPLYRPDNAPSDLVRLLDSLAAGAAPRPVAPFAAPAATHLR